MFFFRSLQCLDCTRSFLTLLVFIENITPQHCKLNRMPKGQKFRESLNFLQRHRSGKLQIFKGHNLNNIRCPKTEDHVIFYLNLKMKAQSGMWNKFFSRFAIHFISYFLPKILNQSVLSGYSFSDRNLHDVRQSRIFELMEFGNYSQKRRKQLAQLKCLNFT